MRFGLDVAAASRGCPEGHVIGVDTNGDFLDYARARAAEEGITNVDFRSGDIFSLPFDNDSFDLVWCKHVLQWVNEPVQAVQEFRRVTRPGGVVVCCHFDGFGITHYPVDDTLQHNAEALFSHTVDPNIGRKCFAMFRQAGLADITVNFEPDPLYTVAGAIDLDRRRNWEVQLAAALPAAVEVLGSEQAAADFVDRFLAYHDNPETFTACNLYFVSGTVP